MSHDASSYVNSNVHDSAMIMKILQQSKSIDVTTQNLRHNSEIQNNNTDEYFWYYLDPKNNVQGPFHDNQMFQWWSQGIYFQNSLLMRRKADLEFSTLQDYSKRFNGVPFNRKDIRVPPLTESLSNNNFAIPKIYNNNYMSHTHLQQNSQINDPSVILQMFSGASNTSPEEVAKILQKVNLHSRVPNHIESSHSIIPSIQNGSDPYLFNDVSNSLSSFVKPPHFNSNQYQLTQAECKSLPVEGYSKQDRFPGPSWSSIPQPTLSDSVWTSQNKERIPPHNTVWSQSNNDVTNLSHLTNIFQDTKTKPTTIQTDPRNCNPMQDSLDNLDPAIIKIAPSIDHSLLSVNSNAHKDLASPRQTTPPTDIATNRMHSDNTKSPWAEMVRKKNSTNSIKYNSENELFTNHSTSPNQHKTSLTSNSSDENDHQSPEPSDKDLESLIIWSKNYLENKPGLIGVDISTLVELLSSVESPYEVEALVRENIPDFDNISDFVKTFLEKRRPLRLKLANDNQKKKSKSPPKLDENTKWQVKSKNHQGSAKKKRKNNKN